MDDIMTILVYILLTIFFLTVGYLFYAIYIPKRRQK